MNNEQYIKLKNGPRNESEKKLLIKIKQKILQGLHQLNKTVEWLAWESEVARSTVQRVFEANRNVGILTLDRIAKGLGYKSIIEFLNTI